jgi:type I restriction enzyme S subunit
MSKWEWKKLGDLYPIVMGKTPPRGNSSYWDKEKKTHNVWVSIADISANENGVIRDSKEYISNKAAKNIKLVSPDSLLVSFKLSIGKMAFTGVPLYTNEAIISLPPREDISLEYLHKYFLYFDWDKACSGDVKVKGKTLNKEKLKDIDVLVPPLSEQKRIVKFLDEEFSKIDTLKTNAETNLKNAKELFETTLEKELNPLSRHSERSEESDADLPSGWEWKTLGNVCEILSDLINPTEEKYLNMYHVGGANIESETGRIIDLKTSEEEGLTSGKFVFDDSVVLYNKIRPYLKKVARPNFAGICSADMYPLSPKNGMLKDFLYYILISSDFTDYAIKHSDRAGMPKLNRKALFVYEFPLPPLSVQKEIVARLDKLSENVKRLETNYKQIIANCDELKKSILKKTFEGDSRSSRE